MKAEVLAARPDGLRNVFGLGGRHHEDDVGRRLLECLQQGIESCVSNLVCFVEDVHLEAIACGRVAGSVAKFAYLVDAAVGGSVDFDDIDSIALADFSAGFTYRAWLRRWPLGRANLVAAVERHGQDAGDGGFADAAMAGKNISVRYPVLAEGVKQGTGHVILAGHIGESLRTVFSGQNLITHGESAPFYPPPVKTA